MQIKFLSSIAFILVSLLLIFQNIQDIALHFLFFSFTLSLPLFILILLAFGSIITIGMTVFKELQYKRMLVAKNREILKLKREISKLNNSSFGQGVASSQGLENTNSSLTSQDLEILFEKNLSIAKEKLDFDQFISDVKRKKNVETNPSKDNAELKKDTTSIKKSIDSIITDFDDLDDEHFSLKKTLHSQKAEEDLPWYMRKHSVLNKKKENESPKEKYQSREIHLKNAYNEYLSKMENSAEDTHATSPKKELSNKRGKKIASSKEKFRKKEIVHKKIASHPSKKTPTPAKKGKKLHKDTPAKELPYQIEIEITPENLIKETLTNSTQKNKTQNIATIGPNDIDLTSSFLKTHHQETNPQRTLSRNSVKEQFNWEYDEAALNKEKSFPPKERGKGDYSENPSPELLKEKIRKLFSPTNLLQNRFDTPSHS